MLENFMDFDKEGSFLEGVSHFLDNFEFDNAITQDLFTELEEVSSLPITKVCFEPFFKTIR